MLIEKILEIDLHRSKKKTVVPMFMEIPAIPEFLPSLVSSTSGSFLVSRKLFDNSYIRVGVFTHDPDKIDQILPNMIQSAIDLSIHEEWPNMFDDVPSAFGYILKTSCVPAQPHICLVPNSWTSARISKIFKVKRGEKYEKYCRVVSASVPCVTFLSKPDMVGLYTRIHGTLFTSILLHNVKKGMAFCLDR